MEVSITTMQDPLSASLMMSILSFRSCSMAVLTPFEMLEPKDVGWRAESLSFIWSSLSGITAGKCDLGPPVRVETTSTPLFEPLKNSVGSGMTDSGKL